MLKIHSNSARMALMASAALAFGACAKKDAATTDSGMAATADTGMKMADTAMAAAPAPGLTDANIVYILDKANELDSTTGSVAATKGTSSDVKEYARMMMRDHHSLRKQGQDLAKKLGVTPMAPAADNSGSDMTKAMAMLTGATKGKDFDKAYIDDQVTYHKNLLETATAAMGAAQNADLKNFIQKAAPSVQAHLDRGEAIQKKMM